MHSPDYVNKRPKYLRLVPSKTYYISEKNKYILLVTPHVNSDQE